MLIKLKYFILYIISIFSLLIIISCQSPVSEKEGAKEEREYGYIHFKISFEGGSGNTFSPDTAAGTDETLTITGNTSYNRYRISFTGDADKLPGTVSVTITWTQQDATSFYWGNDNSFSGTLTVNVPRSGGTIGRDGTLVDTNPNYRPAVSLDTPGTLGTVKFEADNVDTLICTVVRE